MAEIIPLSTFNMTHSIFFIRNQFIENLHLIFINLRNIFEKLERGLKTLRILNLKLRRNGLRNFLGLKFTKFYSTLTRL